MFSTRYPIIFHQYNIVYSIVDVFHKISNYIPPIQYCILYSRCFPQDIQLDSTKYNIVYSIVEVFHKISNYIPPIQYCILYSRSFPQDIQLYSTKYNIVYKSLYYSSFYLTRLNMFKAINKKE